MGGADKSEATAADRRDAERREELIARIAHNYREMAGLSLTEPQAQRLFQIADVEVLRRILNEMVRRGIVRISEGGLIMRADSSLVPPRF